MTVRAAEASDATLVAELCAAEHATERFAPPATVAWPDPTGRHRAWLAFEPDGTACGALVIWDGEPVRRLRIVRYRAADLPLRVATGIAARLGMTNPLPAPGEVFGLWATRVVAIRRGGSHTLRALLEAALGAAAAAGQSVLQINLHARDPLLRRLPPYPPVHLLDHAVWRPVRRHPGPRPLPYRALPCGPRACLIPARRRFRTGAG